MPGISRKGDTNSPGGQITRGAKTVFANNIEVGLHVSPITPHSPWGRKSHPPHKSAKTTSGSPTVYAENVPVLRIGSSVSCGHPIVKGSGDVFVE